MLRFDSFPFANMNISSQTLDQLRRYDSPTICNVIELFEIRPDNTGYMDGRVRANFPELPPMVGFAATAQFRSAAPPVGGDGYGGLAEQLELFATLPGPAVVVFQDVDDPPVAAAFGEVMCSTYRAYHAAGILTNGAGRDLEQVRALKFPAFTGSTIVSHGCHQMLHIGMPVRIGGLMVYTGDLLHGDANGVTNIPPQIAAEVADAAAEFVALENIVMDYVKGAGEKTLEGFKQVRGQFQAELSSLKRRVSRKAAT
jgi:regulator of RNase E activity RraA